MTERKIHPEGTFSGELLSFGEIKRGISGIYYFMAEFDTGEGMPVFAAITGNPNTLIIIYRSFKFLKKEQWTIKVRHKVRGSETFIIADAWPENREDEVYA